jgi:SAM-dependent methyltransferase
MFNWLKKKILNSDVTAESKVATTRETESIISPKIGEKELSVLQIPVNVCSVCGGMCSLLDVLDFNKSCEESKGLFLELSGFLIDYMLCSRCGFCFAPQIANWSLEEFEERIYNDQYIKVDPDYVDARPRLNAANLISLFGEHAGSIRHLDYGGGSGLLSSLLKESNWNSSSYDPFVNRDVNPEEIGKFDLVSAFEVFEHVPEPRELMKKLRSILSSSGMVVFSTVVSDGNIYPNQRLNWSYASPRNGHISLFSRQSLHLLAEENGFHFSSLSDIYHLLFTNIPPWASHKFKIKAT